MKREEFISGKTRFVVDLIYDKPQPEMKKQQIIEVLKEFNPYPESVFIPITDKELKAVVKLLKDNGYSPDALFGHWGRQVWNNCVEKAKEMLFDELQTKELSDEEVEKRAIALLESGMALQDESPVSYTHKQICLHEAQGLRAGAKWYREQIK